MTLYRFLVFNGLGSCSFVNFLLFQKCVITFPYYFDKMQDEGGVSLPSCIHFLGNPLPSPPPAAAAAALQCIIGRRPQPLSVCRKPPIRIILRKPKNRLKIYGHTLKRFICF